MIKEAGYIVQAVPQIFCSPNPSLAFIAQPKPIPTLTETHPCPTACPNPNFEMLGFALTCNSSLSVPLSRSHLSTQVSYLLESCITAQFTEANALLYPTTSVVSSQITIYTVGWSEATSLHNPSSALLCSTLPIPCLYLPISLPI